MPKSLPWSLWRPLLWILSLIWVAGGRLKRVAATARLLDTPVISIGGLAMGGVGKTPMVLYLAEALRSRSYKVAVLTRGYRRRSRRDLCLAKGSDAPLEATGDEAQLLLKTTDVGIGADRWSVGKQMEEQFHPDVFLLDDGFQHAKLERAVDMVLLDGIDPLAGDAPFPVGRLREPSARLIAPTSSLSRVRGAAGSKACCSACQKYPCSSQMCGLAVGFRSDHHWIQLPPSAVLQIRTPSLKRLSCLELRWFWRKHFRITIATREKN